MNDTMNNATLIEIIKKLLKTDVDLTFLMTLPESDLKTLVARIRDRVDQLTK